MASRSGSGMQSGKGTSKTASGTSGSRSGMQASKSSSGAGGSQATQKGSISVKPLTNYAIHKGYGGTLNFMHSHGLRMWNPEDVDTMHAITDEYKAELQAEREADARAAAGNRGPNPATGYGKSQRR